jgi:hypothetical protein
VPKSNDVDDKNGKEEYCYWRILMAEEQEKRIETAIAWLCYSIALIGLITLFIIMLRPQT